MVDWISGRKRIVGKKGTFFPQVTIVHNFVFVKKGWRHLENFLDKYQMDQSHSNFIDPKRIYELFR